jgi:hypothetical protein
VLGETEIGQVDVIVSVVVGEQHVGGFHIAVYKPDAMGSVKR